MKTKTIEVLTLASDGRETDVRDFETMKQARAWVKDCAHDVAFWERSSESEGYASRNVHTVRLMVNGECVGDWFPKFPVPVSSSPTEFVAVKEFEAELVRETCAGPVQSMGTKKNRMELYRGHKSYGDCIIWNWGKTAPVDDEEVIGLIFEGMKVIDYDGVFSLPREACQLLASAGYDLSELGLDGEGNDIPFPA